MLVSTCCSRVRIRSIASARRGALAGTTINQGYAGGQGASSKRDSGSRGSCPRMSAWEPSPQCIPASSTSPTAMRLRRLQRTMNDWSNRLHSCKPRWRWRRLERCQPAQEPANEANANAASAVRRRRKQRRERKRGRRRGNDIR